METLLEPNSLATSEITDLEVVRGVPVPAGVRFRQILVTGPPCSGKSTLIERLGGWPEEGAVDIATKNWWQHGALMMRPREIHLVIPFKGEKDSRTVFDPAFLGSSAELDLERIKIPPRKRGIFGVNWRARYVFDFQLPSPGAILDLVRARIRRGSHPGDAALDLRLIERQWLIYARIAYYFHGQGMAVVVRRTLAGNPHRFK